MKKIFLLFLLLFVTNIFSQDGTLDTSFNSSDIGHGFGDGFNEKIRTTAIQPDGKIIVGGDFSSYNSTSVNRIIRINTDGTLDKTFNVGSGADNTVLSIEIQNDGKILVGGLFTLFNNVYKSYLVRLNIDGSIDNSFIPGIFNGIVFKIKKLNDGKIIVGGSFTTVNGNPQNRLVKLNLDGSVDSSFNINSGFNNTVLNLTEQSDNKIIVCGSFTQFGVTTANRLLRLNSNGSLDSSFNIGSGFNGSVLDVAIQSSNKIVAVGSFTDFNGTTANRITRLNSNGTRDSNFIPNTGFDASCYKVTVGNDDKIYVGGVFTLFDNQVRNLLARLNTDGSLDSTFNAGNINEDGITTIPFNIKTINVLANGDLYVGGFFAHLNNSYRWGFAKLNNLGFVKQDFNQGTGISGLDSMVIEIAITNDSKIIAVGDFDSYNGVTQRNITKINDNGELDTSFITGSGANNRVLDLAIQTDNKIIIVGNFTKFNNVNKNYICRLNADGSIDNSFNIGSGFNNYAFKIQIQSDGKILVLSNAISYNGTSFIGGIIRLNSDGTLDTTFNIGTGPNSLVHSFKLQNDGKILIGGNFTSFNGFASDKLVRLNSDGSIDNSFQIPIGPNHPYIEKIYVQNDNKIILIGGFTTFNNSSFNNIVRLNPNGFIDNTFDIGQGFQNAALGYSSIHSVLIQPDNKILISGNFSSYNLFNVYGLVRLNSNGTLDTSFNTGNEILNNFHVGNLKLDNNNNIIITGSFLEFNTTGKNKIARLNNTNTLSVNNFKKKPLQVYPNPFNSKIHITNCENESFTVYRLDGAKVLSLEVDISKEIDLSNLSSGVYILKSSNGESKKIVKI